jgi:hypothetical protein
MISMTSSGKCAVKGVLLVRYNSPTIYSKGSAMNKFIRVGGLKTRYLDEGTGPAAVFVHGVYLGFSADVFQSLSGRF